MEGFDGKGKVGGKGVPDERKQECIDGNLVCGVAVDSVTDELLFKPGDGGDKHGEQGYIMDTVMGVEGGGVADMIGEELLCKRDHAQGTLGDEVAMKEEVIEDKLDENEVADMMDDESGNSEEEGVEGIVGNGFKQGEQDDLKKMKNKGKGVGMGCTWNEKANGEKQGDKGCSMDTDLGAEGDGVVDKLGKERCKPDGFMKERVGKYEWAINYEKYLKLVCNSFVGFSGRRKVRDRALQDSEKETYLSGRRAMQRHGFGDDPRTEVEAAASWWLGKRALEQAVAQCRGDDPHESYGVLDKGGRYSSWLGEPRAEPSSVEGRAARGGLLQHAGAMSSETYGIILAFVIAFPAGTG